MQHDFAAGPANNKVSRGRIVGGSLGPHARGKPQADRALVWGTISASAAIQWVNWYDYNRLALLRLPCSKTVHLTKKAEALIEALVQRDFSSLMP
jgi:hypothetical protein